MEILSREISKDGENIIVIENTKKVYTYNDLLREIQNIQTQKFHYIEQSKRLKHEYDELKVKEVELQTMLDNAEGSAFEEIID